MKYTHLFSPIPFNGIMLKNRIIAAPISDEYEEKAKGGAALVVCGHSIVEYGRSSFASGYEQSAFFKYEVEKTQQKIRTCHKAGARASIELFHAGLYARTLPDTFAWGPCAFVREDGVEVRALDEENMTKVIELYANEAKNAKDLGFDAIFLHFGHGWLPAQFLSPLYNHRTDEFGGCIENRAKFPLMILKRIREVVGPTYPIEMRISGEECVPGSIKFEDTLSFILMAEPYIDSVQISAGLDINYEGNTRCASTNLVEHMPNLHWAKEVKKHVKKINVSMVGAIMGPDEAEEILAKGYVDTVAFGRSFNADPDWPNKAKEGREEDIRPCLRCNQCYHITTYRRNVGCSVNPRYHNEKIIEKEVTPTNNPKKVVVVGAGPAGMMCAITASKRGHQVVLLEKNSEVGGALNLIAKEHYKVDVARYLQYLKTQLAKSEVETCLNYNATPEKIKEMQPDALVLALGGEPVVIPIEGVHLPHVMTYEQAIMNPESVGNHPLIIGGGTIGLELAIEFNEIHGKDVTIVELTDKLAAQGNMLYRIALRQKYESLKNPLKIHCESKATKITKESVVLQSKDGSIKEVYADTVILCTGVKSKRDIIHEFYGITCETYEIGDVIRPRLIQEATFEGYGVGETI
ncbi:MAG: FAD-dependent oxidoreductase [Erysipelotrichaceae bacterium]|nr:FAD-dependent oxidoreductase [Erysipelotrichaceae bacterium]